MKSKLAQIVFLAFLTFSITSFTISDNREIIQNITFQSSHFGTKIICIYTFENVSSEVQIEQLKAEISLLKEVEGIKSVYKPENGRGQITVIIVEPQRVSESQSMFDITQIKKLIISNGLTPLDVNITEEILD